MLAASAELLELLEHVLVGFGGDGRRFVFGKGQARERRRLERGGLCWRGLFPGNIRRWRGHFLDAKEGLAGAALQEEAVGGLCNLRNRLDLLAVDLHLADDGRTGDVVVPQ